MPIKLGVSFYSYQLAYYKGDMDLEGCIKATAKTVGSEGIQFLPEQTPVGSYPDPSDADVENWFALMDKYKTEPVCMDVFIDYMLYKDRILTIKEQVQQMERDLKLASRLGFKVIRVLCPVRKEIVEASIPIAEQYNVKMGLEVHAPMMFKARWVQEYLEMYERSGSNHVGIIPDFGIFQKKPPRKAIENALKGGANEKIVDYIVSSYGNGIEMFQVIKDIGKQGAGPQEMMLAGSLVRSRYVNPDELKDIAKYLFHFHAKFYEMNKNCEETGIDYKNPIRILKEIGYDGYLCSEYEGQRLYIPPEEPDEIEQVRRHHVMMRKYIEEA